MSLQIRMPAPTVTPQSHHQSHALSPAAISTQYAWLTQLRHSSSCSQPGHSYKARSACNQSSLMFTRRQCALTIQQPASQPGGQQSLDCTAATVPGRSGTQISPGSGQITVSMPCAAAQRLLAQMVSTTQHHQHTPVLCQPQSCARSAPTPPQPSLHALTQKRGPRPPRQAAAR
jgi:hypothetical protein